MVGLTRLVLSLTLGVVVSASVHGQQVLRPAADRYRKGGGTEVPDFQRHVVPLLSRLGCNSAKCHGSFQGRGGFRLSLFGFDFRTDLAALRGDAESIAGKRVNLQQPARSLILLKATEQTDHEGGRRFRAGSWQHRLLLRWIGSGAAGARFSEQPTGDPPRPARSAVAFFKQRVEPILENHCFECHAGGRPKAGLRLTSREQLLTGGQSGPAVTPRHPDKSLLLRAVRYTDEALQMPPAGKLKPQQIADLEKWIRDGAIYPPRYDPQAAGETAQVLKKLTVEPAEVVFAEPGQTRQLKVVAQWQDGTREDVTCLSRFQANDPAVVRVDADGRATSTGAGDSHVVAFYDNGVVSIPVLRPYATPGAAKAPSGTKPTVSIAPSPHPIDRRVRAKLDKLQLIPSPRCSDAEFLRRVSIDLTGTLPTPAEVRTFLGDQTPDKRRRKIDELLARPTYAAWWSNKLCDFTGCNPASIRSLQEVATEQGYVRASEWYDWIYARVAQNEPYDRLVAGILLADLSQPPGSGGMPYFWTRQSLKEPKDTAMSVAHAFLGIQLQCAECHKHPFDRWTQADFNDFSRFFDSLTGRKLGRATLSRPIRLRLLRSDDVRLKAGDDPRQPIMQWMREKTNPWFARAFVNRVWAGYFHVGIVEPPDQFTPANPPSNPQLLDWLTQEFIRSGYDMKRLHRQIATSETYQRSWRPNATNRQDRRNYSRAIPRRLPAEVVYDAMKQATAASDRLQEVRTNLKRRASGHLSMRMAGTHAMKVFGKPDRAINCDCERVNEPTLLQAIFVQNDPLVRMRLADSGWLAEIEEAERARKTPPARDVIDLVWLRTVSRLPTAAEAARARKHLQTVPTMAEGLRDLLWAMLNTKEFLLNH